VATQAKTHEGAWIQDRPGRRGEGEQRCEGREIVGRVITLELPEGLTEVGCLVSPFPIPYVFWVSLRIGEVGD
jgi:hypothetical protein